MRHHERTAYHLNRIDGSIEQAGYEFANAQTEEYRKEWWDILLERVKATQKPATKGER